MRMRFVGRAIYGGPVRAHVLREVVTPQFERLVGSLRGCRVLEIGAGSGTGAQLLLERLDAHEVHALDLDPRMLRLARARVGRRVPTLLADMSAIPAASASYDAVVGFGALHLADDWRGALHEIARVLRPAGRFLFEQPTNPLHRIALKRPGGGRLPGGFGYVELISGIERAGLEVTARVGAGIGGIDLVGVARKVAQSKGQTIQAKSPMI